MQEKRKKRKKSKRERTKYPALDPKLNLKTRYEEIADVAEYAHKLNEQELDFLNRFMEESVNANFNHKGKKIHKKDHQKKAIYRSNNARNKCILTRAKAYGDIKYFDDLERDDRLTDSPEDLIIDKIDREDL